MNPVPSNGLSKTEQSCKSLPWQVVSWVLLLIYSLAILLYIRSPFWNVEGVFGQAAQDVLHKGFWAQYPVYRNIDVNPEFQLYMVALFQRLLGFSEFSTRLPSFLMGLTALLATYLFFVRYDRRVVPFIIVFLIVNPLFFIFSGSAVNDIHFFALNALAIYLFWHGINTQSRWQELTAAFVQGISCITKYQGFLFLPLIAIFYYTDGLKHEVILTKARIYGCIKRMLVPGMIIFSLSGIYMAFVILRYGSLFNPEFADWLKFRPEEIPAYSVFYLFWFVILASPFLPVVIPQIVENIRRRPKILAAALGVVIFSFAILHWGINPDRTYEVRLPSFMYFRFPRTARFLPAPLAGVAVLLLHSMYAWARQRKGFAMAAFLWLCCSLAFYSVRIPSARYCIVWLIPLTYWQASSFLAHQKRLVLQKVLISLAVVACLSLNLALLAYSDRQAVASVRIARYINEHRLAGLRPSIVIKNSDYLIDPSLWGSKDRYQYYLYQRVYQRPGVNDLPLIGQVIKEEPVRMFGWTIKTFMIVKRNP